MASSFALGAEKRIVRDPVGREVRVPQRIEAIVSLAPSITEIVFALGQGTRLRGVTLHCDFPPEAGKLPKIGSYIHPDLEKIVSLRPDLCIGTKDGNPAETVGKLENLGIPVFIVNPRDLESVMTTILELGSLIDADEKAEDLVTSMKNRIVRIQEGVSKASERPRVFFQIGSDPIVSVGTDTFLHQLIVMAGGINLAAGSTAYPRFSCEDVLKLAPEVLIISSMAPGEDYERIKAGWLQWRNLPAARSQRVFVVDSNRFDRPSPRLVEALEILAHLIHPEIF